MASNFLPLKQVFKVGTLLFEIAVLCSAAAGKSGSWKKYLTVAQNEQFDRVYKEKMREVTVSFPWD